ncbi:MAG: FIST C-terminal domain-containing protein [Planctomycetes bacterium]|nr:FIST C-terminal domain-containing protein [Planctomycetota bacterium]
MSLPGTFTAVAGLSLHANTQDAAMELSDQVIEQLGQNPDFLTVFFTPEHSVRAGELGAELAGRLTPDVMIGASACGVVSGAIEVEHGPGVAVLAGRIPGSRVQGFHLEYDSSGEGGMVSGWPDVGQEASTVLLADPYSFPLSPFLTSLRRIPKMPHVVGGVVSGGNQPGENRMLLDGKVVTDGVIGMVIDGLATLEPLVAQGCRPLGPTFTVTKAEDNVILELDSNPAYERLRGLLDDLDGSERQAFRQQPQVGLRKVQSDGDLGSGGYVIRGVIGIDPTSGSVAVADQVETGMRMQFHARDGEVAHQDMAGMLGLASGLYPNATAGLIFTCTGRGEGMFGRPSHDAGITQRYFPDLPVAGMFAAGEIGSVCGRPYIHGFSASMGLLIEREDSSA